MQKAQWRYFDIPLLLGAIAVAIFGVTMITSATANDPTLGPLNMGMKQLQIGLGGGLIILFLLARIDYRAYRSFMILIYAVMCGSLLLVDLAGKTTLGSQRWITLGFFDWQPSETAKILLILIMADFLAGNEHRLARFPVFVVALIVATPPIILVFFQPDLGTTLVLVIIWLVMTWYAGIDRFYLLTMFFIAIPIIVIAWNYKYTDSTGQPKEIFSEYQRTRLEAFINPDAVAQSEGRNLITSRNAVTNGGLLGQGWGNGTNNKYNYLTIRHTDFIFSVIAEEFGFMGGVVLFTVLTLILLRILYVAQNAGDSFGRNICIGVMTMLLFQVVVNVGMNVGLMPVTGITLPLISQGNSSMWSVFMGLGLVQSVAIRSRREITWNYRTGPVLQ